MGKLPASRYLPVYRLKSDTVARLLRVIVFFGLVTLAIASETLNVLVNAACEFFSNDPATTRKRSGEGTCIVCDSIAGPKVATDRFAFHPDFSDDP